MKITQVASKQSSVRNKTIKVKEIGIIYRNGKLLITGSWTNRYGAETHWNMSNPDYRKSIVYADILVVGGFQIPRKGWVRQKNDDTNEFLDGNFKMSLFATVAATYYNNLSNLSSTTAPKYRALRESFQVIHKVQG